MRVHGKQHSKNISSPALCLDLGFVLSGADNVRALTFCITISKQHLQGGREWSSAWTCLSLFIVRTSLWLSSTHKANQIQISPLVKISHFSLSLQSSQSCLPQEQSALLDQICRRFFCNIPSTQSLDYTINIYIFFFAFQSLSPHQSTNKGLQRTRSDSWERAKKFKSMQLKTCTFERACKLKPMVISLS